MSRKKKHKKSDKNYKLETIVLITAVIQLITAILALVQCLS